MHHFTIAAIIAGTLLGFFHHEVFHWIMGVCF